MPAHEAKQGDGGIGGGEVFTGQSGAFVEEHIALFDAGLGQEWIELAQAQFLGGRDGGSVSGARFLAQVGQEKLGVKVLRGFEHLAGDVSQWERFQRPEFDHPAAIQRVRLAVQPVQGPEAAAQSDAVSGQGFAEKGDKQAGGVMERDLFVEPGSWSGAWPKA